MSCSTRDNFSQYAVDGEVSKIAIIMLSYLNVRNLGYESSSLLLMMSYSLSSHHKLPVFFSKVSVE